MRFTLEIELDKGVQTFDDVVTAVQACAGSLSDSTAILSAGETAKLWDDNGDTVGKWEVTETPEPVADALPTLRRANLLLYDMWAMLEAETRASRPQRFGMIERRFREHLQNLLEPVTTVEPVPDGSARLQEVIEG
jgi:hypothetical protein